MRMLMKISIPNDGFNPYVRNGSAGHKMQEILGQMKPEAVYFTEMNGKRTGICILDVPQPSAVPALAEPWFVLFNAEVEFHIVMSPDDLAKSGLEEMAKNWG